MTVTEQFGHVAGFFIEALNIVRAKGKDYAPENIAMIDVFYAAAETDQRPQAVLWTYVRKHLTAVRGWMANGSLASEYEDIHSRLLDIANYMAMIDYVNEHEQQLIAAVAEFNALDPHQIDEDQKVMMRNWLHRMYGYGRA